LNVTPVLKQSVAENWLRFDIDSGGVAVAALGVDLKNSLCLTGSGHAYLSHVNGDINEPEIYRQVNDTLSQLNDVEAVACDLHPDLHSTRLAEQLSERLDVPLIRVQHHHAHIAAVMAEHAIEAPVIGLALDGFGFGTDGTAWGGECLYVDGACFERVGHIKPVAMPGGDAASREPWRMAVAWLDDEKLSKILFSERPVTMVGRLCHAAGTPLTSSAGRLFDAAAAIVLGIEVQGFEGEAAMALEREASTASNADELDGDPARMVRQMAEAVIAGADRASLALGLHHAMADHFAAMAIRAAESHGTQSVALAGGCFMNRLLRERVTKTLGQHGLHVYAGERMPHGDGAIAFGQAWVAARQLRQERS